MLSEDSLQSTTSTSLVYYENYDDVHKAIGREKELTGWLRVKKVALIESVNPKWKDLSFSWSQKHRFTPDIKKAS